jgi:hypothetical protein
MFNGYATLTQNGVPHQAPKGFRDSDFSYVWTLPLIVGTFTVLAASGAAGSEQTLQGLTHGDSLFCWVGMEFSIDTADGNAGGGVGVRIRYNQEYLSTDYLYSKTCPSQAIAPYPVFPPRWLPPLSQITINFLNNAATAYGNYALVMRGFKRLPV